MALAIVIFFVFEKRLWLDCKDLYPSINSTRKRDIIFRGVLLYYKRDTNPSKYIILTLRKASSIFYYIKN